MIEKFEEIGFKLICGKIFFRFNGDYRYTIRRCYFLFNRLINIKESCVVFVDRKELILVC